MVIVYLMMQYPFGSTHAFDGKREGIFFGLGVEPGTAIWQITDDYGTSSFAAPSITVPTFKFGFGLSEQFLFYFTNRTSLNGGQVYNYDTGDTETSDIFSDGTSGLGFTYFLNRGRSLYFSGCLGLATSVNLNEPDAEDISVGVGIAGGIGFEVSRNIAVDVMLDYRTYTDTYWDSYYYADIDETVNVITFSLALNVVIY